MRPTQAGSYKELPDQCNWAMGGRWRPASGVIDYLQLVRWKVPHREHLSTLDYKMLETEEMDLVELDDAYKCNWVIWFSILRLLRTEDIMRPAYASLA
ncbi:hypothetical protein T06_2348 [Trichinella sp. T6]|nr:hypothetical protein T06_2348 [Trichinella sp. T6]